jgi:hypothetical protein
MYFPVVIANEMRECGRTPTEIAVVLRKECDLSEEEILHTLQEVLGMSLEQIQAAFMVAIHENPL